MCICGSVFYLTFLGRKFIKKTKTFTKVSQWKTQIEIKNNESIPKTDNFLMFYIFEVDSIMNNERFTVVIQLILFTN